MGSDSVTREVASPDLRQLATVAEVERAALERLPAASAAYLMTGSGEERAVAANREAFERRRLLPDTLVDVSGATTVTTVLGRVVAAPILVAPTASHLLFHPEGEVATAQGAARAGTVLCVASAASRSLPDITEAAPDARRWLQVHPLRDRGLLDALVARAAECGAEALVLTVDAPVRSRRVRAERGGHVSAEMGLLRDVLGVRAEDVPPGTFADLDPSMTWSELERLAARWPLPVIPKGVMAPGDARRAADAGCPAVIVSNHGGRQLEDAHGTLDALPGVASAAEGRLEVLVDGGVRRGADVVKALGLGARAVLVGRPVVWGLAAGGAEGVAAVLELLRAELLTTLQLLGCPSPAAVQPRHVQTADACAASVHWTCARASSPLA
jgi:4-hydroxymandelate oxidase